MLIHYCFYVLHIPVLVVAPSSEVAYDILFLTQKLDGCDCGGYTVQAAENTLQCAAQRVGAHLAPLFEKTSIKSFKEDKHIDLQNDKEMLSEIYDIGEKLYAGMCSKERSCEGYDDVFALLTELGRTLVGADRASLWKWDKENHELWTTSATKMNRYSYP